MNDMDLRSVLVEIHDALDEAGIGHALIGGLALAAHGAARATIDLDLLAEGVRSPDVHRILLSRGYQCIHGNENVANFLSDDPVRGRVDFLFARRARGLAILSRAAPFEVLGGNVRVVDAADLIGLKVQGYANNPRRRLKDLSDIQRVLRFGQPDLVRVREYFQLFDCEKDLDAILAEESGP